MKFTKRWVVFLLSIIAVGCIGFAAAHAAGLLTKTADPGEVGYTVTGLTVENGEIQVSYQSPEASTLVVALYTEDGYSLLHSTAVGVNPGETAVDIAPTEALPANFFAAAYLLDNYDQSPLSPAYVTSAYTSGYRGLENGGFGTGGSTDFDNLFSPQETLSQAGVFSVLTGEYDGETKTASFTDLIPGGEYVLLSVVSRDVTPITAADNLLYIRQGTAAQDGTLSFTYAENPNEGDVLLCGPSNQNLLDAEVVFPAMTANGTAQTVAPVITYEGETLVEGQDYVIVSGGSFTEAGEYTCYIRGIYDYTGLIACNYTVAQGVIQPTIQLKYPSLTFESEVYMNLYFFLSGADDVVQIGMIRSDDAVAEITDELVDGFEVKTSGSYTIVRSPGIPAKELGESKYIGVYAKLTDGSYVFTKLNPYSALAYAKDRLKNSTNENLKKLCVAMLNYGAAAQTYMNYNVDTLANASLTADQLAMVEAYRADMVASLTAVDSSKVGIFARNGFGTCYPSVNFEGAFAISYYFKPNNVPDNGMKLYYWDLSAYIAADVLTKENATGVVDMAGSGTALYKGTVEGIAAKEIDRTIFVAGVYEVDGTTYSTGILNYSLGAYCIDRVAKGSETMQALAQATAVYGYYAEIYFANN